MAENEDGQDRSEEPTGKRLQDARQKGQVARSQELTTFISLMVAGGMLMLMGGDIVEGISEILRRHFILDRQDLENVEMMHTYFLQAVIDALLVLAPFLAAMLIAGIVGNTAMSGWNFTASAMGFKGNKLNPITGMKRIFGVQGLANLGKALGKFIIVGAAAYAFLTTFAAEFFGLGGEPLNQGMEHAANLMLWAFILISSSMLILVLFDVPYQLWNHKRQLKMTKQEVKEERKQTEGSPEVKRAQRQKQFQAAQARMMQQVPEADVIVTNPTHYAIALKYDQEKMDAPVLVAKGMNLIAAKIRGIAEEHDIPVLSAPPLARALYHSTELDEPIPFGLYRAVAQILAYVFHLRDGTVYGEGQPIPNLHDLPIPEEYRRDK